MVHSDLVSFEDKAPRKQLIWCFWAFFLILVPLSAVILIGFALFGSGSTAFDEKSRIANILLMITYVIVICGIYTTLRSIDNVSLHQHSSIVLTFIFALGVGDSLFIMTEFGDELILILNKNYASNSQCSTNIAISMAANLLKSLCQLSILMLILYYLNHSVKLKYQTSKVFLTCLPIFCFIEWLEILLQEVRYHQHKHDSCALPTSEGLKQFDQITPFLYPLGLEYRFATFIELIIISEYFRDDKKNFLSNFYNWLSKMSGKSGSSKKKTSMISNRLKTVLSFTSRCISKSKQPFGKHDIFFSAILLPAGGIFLVTLSVIIVLFQEFNMDDEKHRITETSGGNNNLLTLISEICEIILAIIISLHSIYSLGKLYRQGNNSEQNPSIEPENNPQQQHSADGTLNIKFKIDFLFLLISNLFLQSYSVLTLVGSIKWKTDDLLAQRIRWLTCTASIIPIFQTILQLIVIWKVRRYNGRITQGINEMWIILSFSIWLFDSFSAKGFDTNQIQISVYGSAWNALAAIFIPMAIFFRFHSCIVFANIKDGAYWHKPDHPSV